MLAVDEYGSFTRAGEELGYTQSGVTQKMKALEKEVGFPLFVKDKQRMSLTKDAKSLIPSIRTLLSANEAVQQEIAALKGAKIAPSKSALTSVVLYTGFLKSFRNSINNTRIFTLKLLMALKEN